MLRDAAELNELSSFMLKISDLADPDLTASYQRNCPKSAPLQKRAVFGDCMDPFHCLLQSQIWYVSATSLAQARSSHCILDGKPMPAGCRLGEIGRIPVV